MDGGKRAEAFRRGTEAFAEVKTASVPLRNPSARLQTRFVGVRSPFSRLRKALY